MATVYETITAQVISAIETGAGEFKMPWHRKATDLVPSNAVTGNCYNGGNVLALWCASMAKGYESSKWATFKQWQAIGAQVRKGEKATTGIYYSTFEKDEDDGSTKHVAFGKAFWLFNAAQVDGYTAEASAPLIDLTQRIEAADAAIQATGANVIVDQGSRSFYRPSTDEIYIVARERFVGTPTSTPTESYYSTLLHELSHWTGAEKRLAREKHKKHGDESYAFEELIAELSAAFLCAKLGIANEPRVDHAQYIASWLKVLKNDTRAITSAASMAQKACDYILQAQPASLAEAA